MKTDTYYIKIEYPNNAARGSGEECLELDEKATIEALLQKAGLARSSSLLLRAAEGNWNFIFQGGDSTIKLCDLGFKPGEMSSVKVSEDVPSEGSNEVLNEIANNLNDADQQMNGLVKADLDAQRQTMEVEKQSNRNPQQNGNNNNNNNDDNDDNDDDDHKSKRNAQCCSAEGGRRGPRGPKPFYPRSETGFVGLKNQGATCYLNSFIQTLYMTPEFRRCIYSWPLDTYLDTAIEAIRAKKMKLAETPEGSPKDPNEKPNNNNNNGNNGNNGNRIRQEFKIGGLREKLRGDSVVYALQTLFVKLQTADTRAISTKRLTASFGWSREEAHVQHDVNETSLEMFRIIEKETKGLPQEGMVQRLFEGVERDYIECLGCKKVRCKDTKFSDINLPVKPFGAEKAVGSLEEALDLFTLAERLTAPNQYACETCGAPQDANKGTTFAKLPYILKIQLKRWDMDYTTFRYSKYNGRITFPETIDMAKYVDAKGSQQNVMEKDVDMMGVGAKKDGGCGGGTVYKLYSVLVHSGGSSGGHYYAYIRDFSKDAWFEFNDSTVRRAAWRDVEATFGSSGSDPRSYGATAYMLVYRLDDRRQNEGYPAVPESYREFVREKAAKQGRKAEAWKKEKVEHGGDWEEEEEENNEEEERRKKEEEEEEERKKKEEERKKKEEEERRKKFKIVSLYYRGVKVQREYNIETTHVSDAIAAALEIYDAEKRYTENDVHLYVIGLGLNRIGKGFLDPKSTLKAAGIGDVYDIFEVEFNDGTIEWAVPGKMRVNFRYNMCTGAENETSNNGGENETSRDSNKWTRKDFWVPVKPSSDELYAEASRVMGVPADKIALFIVKNKRPDYVSNTSITYFGDARLVADLEPVPKVKGKVQVPPLMAAYLEDLNYIYSFKLLRKDKPELPPTFFEYDLRRPFGFFYAHLCELTGLPPAELAVELSSKKTEALDPECALSEYIRYPRGDIVVFASQGHPMHFGEHPVTLALVDPENQKLIPLVKEFVVQERCLVSVLRSQIAETYGGMIGIPAEEILLSIRTTRSTPPLAYLPPSMVLCNCVGPRDLGRTSSLCVERSKVFPEKKSQLVVYATCLGDGGSLEEISPVVVEREQSVDALRETLASLKGARKDQVCFVVKPYSSFISIRRKTKFDSEAWNVACIDQNPAATLGSVVPDIKNGSIVIYKFLGEDEMEAQKVVFEQEQAIKMAKAKAEAEAKEKAAAAAAAAALKAKESEDVKKEVIENNNEKEVDNEQKKPNNEQKEKPNNEQKEKPNNEQKEKPNNEQKEKPNNEQKPYKSQNSNNSWRPRQRGGGFKIHRFEDEI